MRFSRTHTKLIYLCCQSISSKSGSRELYNPPDHLHSMQRRKRRGVSSTLKKMTTCCVRPARSHASDLSIHRNSRLMQEPLTFQSIVCSTHTAIRIFASAMPTQSTLSSVSHTPHSGRGSGTRQSLRRKKVCTSSTVYQQMTAHLISETLTRSMDLEMVLS